MNEKMAMFLFEIAQKGAKTKWRDLPTEFIILNPYHQWPKPVRKPAFMDRPFGPGYQTHPELSRPGLPIVAGSVMRSPLFLATAVPLVLGMTFNYLHHGSIYAQNKSTGHNDPSEFWKQAYVGKTRV